MNDNLAVAVKSAGGVVRLQGVVQIFRAQQLLIRDEMDDRLASIDIGRKVGGLLCPFLWGGIAGSPSNTMCPGPEAYLRTIQPFDCSLQRYRQTDNGPIA